ncbi:MAG TPA: TolC family protein [Humisphaera sp.]|nr:TolC family protein [Humisphaera sp.]
MPGRDIFLLLLAIALMGCHAERPDISAEAASLTGLENAITFHEAPEPLTAETPVPETLTPLQAVRMALAHDPRIQAALARVRMAEADANQARLLPNPIVTIDVRFPVSSGNTVFEPTLTADLISILEKPATIAAADNRLRGSAANALIVVLDVISEVEQAYSATRAAQGQIENARARQQLLRQLRDIAQKRLEAGDATRLDVLTLDSQLMQSTLDMSDLGLQQETQRMTLARLIGMPLSDAPWQLAPWEAPQQTKPDGESAWIETAMHCRPEISAKRWELRALGDDLKAADLAPLQGDAIGVHAEHDGSWRLGPTITIPIPIFDWGQAAHAKLEAQRMATRHELLQQRREIVQDIRLAYATYMHSMTALADARDKLLPLQRQQIEQARLAYQSGEADLATLLLAETDLQLTQSKMIDLKEKVTVARIKLQRAAGGAAVADRLASGPATAPTTAPATLPATAPATLPATLPTSQSTTGSTP